MSKKSTPQAEQKVQAPEGALALPQTAQADMAGEQAADQAVDTDRIAELEKQLAEMRAAHDAALKELAEARGEAEAAKSEGASPASDPDGYVYVYANLPSGQIFALPDGGKVEIKGVPASLLRGPEGERLKGGKYGVTRVKKNEWDAVLRLYGTMAIFRNGLVFATGSEFDGGEEAHQRRDLRHGFEPLDPRGKKVKTTPAERDDEA
ncbi:MAG TPA: hypothetical protein H9962_06920 [Candidatus Mailhella merdigallinarum]|uniref:Uncharacterized protein n=1 Tax=Candidatus Mailhella merdigallinarum TaxID=2838658 RepID=A0A9D2HE87_9BACT|nr:hypothetical protein [Candidatus Mailhella merdigallinarum]